MITMDEFKNKYQDYSTCNEMEAISDALKLNCMISDGKVVPVKIGDKYCLMEEKAAKFYFNMEDITHCMPLPNAPKEN